MSNRLEVLEQLAAQNPSDTFVRYGLAMEYARTGRLEDAVSAYRDLLAANPDYKAAYYHAGQAYEKLGRLEEARAMYEKGVEVTTRLDDAHTRSELQAALDILG